MECFEYIINETEDVELNSDMVSSVLGLDNAVDFCFTNNSISDERNLELSKAMSMALKDLKNKESSLFKDVFKPFSAYCMQAEFVSMTTFGCKLIDNILHPVKTHDPVKLDAYIHMNGLDDYFSFVVPEYCLKDAFSSTDAGVLQNCPRPGFNFLELGSTTLVNYALGYYYQYLAKWCKNPDDEIVRDLKNWRMGPH